MIYNKIKNRIIESAATLIEAMRLMDSSKVKILFVFKKNQFLNILTIGDIQRAIIRGHSLNEKIEGFTFGDKIYASSDESKESVREKMLNLRAECMPILNNKRELIDVIFWYEIMDKIIGSNRPRINLPVVIMAGGLGTRLRPITNVIPKPLIPIGKKTILEEILDQFLFIGCNQFYMSVNYKYDIIKYYLDQLPSHYNITYFKEEKPLGTIGSISLLKGKINSPFFVSNCDIIIDQDYRDVYDYHVQNHNDITIVTAMKSVSIPYGVIETGDDGLMTSLKEKPEKTYRINTGVYILNPELIDEIPPGEFMHITALMEKVLNRRGRIGCFPVSENSWKDMGEWPEYLKMINVL